MILSPSDRSPLHPGAPPPATPPLLVVDDDPTGTQTATDAPVLLTVDRSALAELLAQHPLVFLSTNSRSMTAPTASALAGAVADAVSGAETQLGHRVSVISRGDSTLRGHVAAETLTLARRLRAELVVVCPALVETGRITLGGVHYVVEDDGRRTPVSATEYADDPTFGFRNSDLRGWLEERTDGEIRAQDVVLLPLGLLRSGVASISARLHALPRGTVVVADAERTADVEALADAILELERTGKRVLVRAAASYVRARAGLAPAEPLRTVPPATGPGLLVAGSYTRRTTEQLERLFGRADIVVVEDREHVGATAAAVDRLLDDGRSVALVTPRKPAHALRGDEALAAARAIADAQVAVVRHLRATPSFMLTKGGITSYRIIRDGLGARRAHVLGPVLPGVPLWLVEHAGAMLPVAVFPGNVGGPDAVEGCWGLLSGEWQA